VPRHRKNVILASFRESTHVRQARCALRARPGTHSEAVSRSVNLGRFKSCVQHLPPGRFIVLTARTAQPAATHPHQPTTPNRPASPSQR